LDNHGKTKLDLMTKNLEEMDKEGLLEKEKVLNKEI
jgi:hypothetical protein